MMPRFLTMIVVSLFSLSQYATGQVVTEVWTDQSSYAYGEIIEVTFKVTNHDSVEHTWTTHCNSPTITFDDVELDYPACVTYTHPFQFTPGSWRSWTFPLDPKVLGLPRSDGDHKIKVKFAHLADSTVVSAPKYMGGRVEVDYRAALTSDSLNSIKGALQAIDLGTYDLTDHSVGTWEISGITLEEAAAKYQGPLFTLTPSRFITSVSSVDIEIASPVNSFGAEVYPNPVQSQGVISIQSTSHETLRLDVFDMLGRKKASLFEGVVLPNTTQRIEFDSVNYAPGVYYFVLLSDAVQKSGSFVVVK